MVRSLIDSGHPAAGTVGFRPFERQPAGRLRSETTIDIGGGPHAADKTPCDPIGQFDARLALAEFL